MPLDPYGVTSYMRSKELIITYVRGKRFIRTHDIVYTKDMAVYIHTSVHTH